MAFRKGDRVVAVANPYEGMLTLPAGTKGTIKRANRNLPQYFVHVRFDNGLEAKAWPIRDRHGTVSIEKEKSSKPPWVVSRLRR